MQDTLNYKITTVINNWFDNYEQDYDYDKAYFKPVDTIFYCNQCQTHKSIKLQVLMYDSQNRPRYRCKDCASKVKKGINHD